VLQSRRVVVARIAATGLVEPLQRSAFVAAVDGCPRVGEIAVWIPGHGVERR